MLKGKNAVLVGGSSGLGLAIAKGFASSGASVAILGRSESKRKQAVKSFQKEGLPTPHHAFMDVGSLSSVKAGFKTVQKRFKTIHVVVCSAGTHLKIPTLEMTDKQWKRVLNINLNGTYYVNTIFGKHMLQKKGGSLINLASLGSRVALSEATAYSVSKSAVEMLTRCLAVEWASKGVRVNALLPGVFPTPLNAKALSDVSRLKKIMKRTPSARLGELSEIVSAALFLASDQSSFVTGTSVTVDGGFLASSGF